MIKTFSIRVSGEVQGVFFRASAKKQADGLNLTGKVRNERDGSVYIEAEGEEDQLEEFLHWCKRGPQHAKVDAIDVSEIDYKDFEGFVIER
jgi:acylphosphatase